VRCFSHCRVTRGGAEAGRGVAGGGR
jgi:hypothetical protein